MKNYPTCFLIDDDIDDQEIFQVALNDINPLIKYETAFDGVDALDKLPRLSPDIMFVDLNMPRMTGDECLVEIKRNPAWAGVPVVVYSTSSYIGEREKIIKLGAADFFTKPISISGLVIILKDIFTKENISF